MAKRRTKEDNEILQKKIIKYYFSTPHDNSFKTMVSKFKVHSTYIRKAISAYLEERFDKAQKARNR